MSDWANLGSAVKRRRTDLGLTQTQLADRDPQLSVATLRRIESVAASSYRDLQLAALARALGWSSETIDRLLGGGEAGPGDLVEPAPRAADDDDDIELDFNSAMQHVPDEVRQAVIRIVKPYLDEK